MKVALEISDSLLREVCRLAARDGVTLRSMVERGLRHVISEKERHTPFKLRHASFKGKGLQPELRYASWDILRDLAYENYGG